MDTRINAEEFRDVRNPRNVWSRLNLFLDTVRSGDFQVAQDILEGLAFHPGISTEELLPYRILLEAHMPAGFVRKLNKPNDYLEIKRTTGLLLPLFRRFKANTGRKIPSEFPRGMPLPPFVGADNDCRFLLSAAAFLAERFQTSTYRVHVVWAPSEGANVARLAERIASQEFDGLIELTIFGRQKSKTPAGERIRFVEGGILSPEASACLGDVVAGTDLVIFLSGDPDLDRGFVARAAYLARASDTVVQPLLPPADAGAHSTAYSINAKSNFESQYPFREILGLNLAVPARLLHNIDILNTRFGSTYEAARELAFRLYNSGAYFFPVRVPAVRDFRDEAHADDAALFRSLSPNHLDRTEDGSYEIPKVSIYIPAYNCSKFIREAVDSVLAQDFSDLDICIWDDGSSDATPQILERHYANEPRVRWRRGRNGGIGYASNHALGMTRGLYIGQLDSDDKLKPGAVKALVQYLDEHPETACCYSSCERVDARGTYIQDEYSWPTFTREKMMLTSIAHHFRMFRRKTWTRTAGFREDIQNGVDYDIFLKMSELGGFHHEDIKLYERRWHGENTSHANVKAQTENTYRVQRQALRRSGLDGFWDVHVPNRRRPRRVLYRRTPGRKMVAFWPDYTASNLYQGLLYKKASQECEICAGDIDSVLAVLHSDTVQPEDLTFHLHWLTFLFKGLASEEEARATVTDLLEKLAFIKIQGARLVWTVHNVVSHDTQFVEIEIAASKAIAEMADAIHFHSAASIDEVETAFPVPREKVLVSRHGSYVGAYPDFVSRALAREQLGVGEDDDVILFTGQVRPYKGVEQLIEAFRSLRARRKNVLLLIAGLARYDPLASVSPELTPEERERIRFTDRFVEDYELQLFLRAADVAVFPYKSILTSGSLMLALSYGLPAVVPSVGMTREVLEGRNAGALLEAGSDAAALEAAITRILDAKATGEIETMRGNALTIARELDWPDITHFFGAAAELEAEREPAEAAAE